MWCAPANFSVLTMCWCNKSNAKGSSVLFSVCVNAINPASCLQTVRHCGRLARAATPPHHSFGDEGNSMWDCIIFHKRTLKRSLKTLRTKQNGHHFTDAGFKRIFCKENLSILIDMSLKFVLKFPIDNKPALVQITPCDRTGWTNDGLIYWPIYALPVLNV